MTELNQWWRLLASRAPFTCSSLFLTRVALSAMCLCVSQEMLLTGPCVKGGERTVPFQREGVRERQYLSHNKAAGKRVNQYLI